MHRTLKALVVLTVLVPLAGCHKLEGRAYFHRGNRHYNNEEYRAALREFQKGLEKDPSATFAWRSVGLSALAQFHPGDDSAENKAMGDTAADAFRKYIAANPKDEKAREYLITALIGNAKHKEAVQEIEEQAKLHPTEVKYRLAVVRTLTEGGFLQEAMDRAEQETVKDPTLFYTIGVTAWSRSFYTPPAEVTQHRQLIELGIKALERADQLNPNSFDNMSYLNLLWREMTKVEIDPFKQQDYLAKADQYFQRAMEIRKATQATAATTPTPGAS
jgi:tetratricopeptide (TPR) repeat protein